jgi:putative membrane protein
LPDVAHVTFEVAPLQLAPALVGGVMYGLRARTLRERGAPVPGWRQGCWYGGLGLMAATLVSPLAHLSEELFAAHMLEHLLLADLGALLLVLGLTGPLLQPVLSAPGLRWLRVFAHPLVALVAWTANFYVWHLPALYQGAVEDDAVHALQHVLFVSFGIAMWMALLGPLPKPAWFGNFARLLYVVVVRLTSTVLANVFVWSNDAFFGVYAGGERAHGISPHTDQVVAGSIMMISAQRERGTGAPGAARPRRGGRRGARRAARSAGGRRRARRRSATAHRGRRHSVTSVVCLS